MSWVILSGDGSGTDRLARWWTDTSHKIDPSDHAGVGGITPLEWVAFIFVGNLHKHHLQDKNTCLPISQESVLRQAPPTEKVLAVFFTWVLFPMTGEQEWHVLGCCPVAKFREGMTIGDLLRTRRFNVAGLVPWQGSTSKSYWPRLCVVAPTCEELDEDSGWVNMDKVMYRRDLMMSFWKNRRNATFVDTDSLEMLWQLHNGEGAFFNLSSDKGREEEYVSYWALAWICAHNPFLWARWAHWERTLFEYRVKKFFFKERHFALLVSANNLTVASSGKANAAILVDDPGDRERDLYMRRPPRSTENVLPSLWLSVPVEQVGRSIAECPDYDIDQGRVIITYQECIPWIWNRMELAANALMKSIFEQSKKKTKKDSALLLSADQSNAKTVLDVGMASIVSVLRVEEEEDAMFRLKRRAEMMMQEYGPGGAAQLSLFDAGTPRALLELAKRRMPPCMARHVWKALIYKQHPKNEARLALVKFLIEAQYEIPEAERVMYLLYEADTAFVRQNHGQWTPAAFKKEYGGQVKQLHESIIVEKRIGAYGCATLTSDEKRDKSCGCPFAMTVGLEARAFLQWAEVKDIEDVMRKPHPQERCCKYYMDRHPDKPPVTVRHPNQFFRGSSYGPPLAVTAVATATQGGGGEPRVKREKIEIE